MRPVSYYKLPACSIRGPGISRNLKRFCCSSVVRVSVLVFTPLIFISPALICRSRSIAFPPKPIGDPAVHYQGPATRSRGRTVPRDNPISAHGHGGSRAPERAGGGLPADRPSRKPVTRLTATIRHGSIWQIIRPLKHNTERKTQDSREHVRKKNFLSGEYGGPGVMPKSPVFS